MTVIFNVTVILGLLVCDVEVVVGCLRQVDDERIDVVPDVVNRMIAVNG